MSHCHMPADDFDADRLPPKPEAPCTSCRKVAVRKTLASSRGVELERMVVTCPNRSAPELEECSTCSHFRGFSLDPSVRDSFVSCAYADSQRITSSASRRPRTSPLAATTGTRWTPFHAMSAAASGERRRGREREVARSHGLPHGDRVGGRARAPDVALREDADEVAAGVNDGRAARAEVDERAAGLRRGHALAHGEELRQGEEDRGVEAVRRSGLPREARPCTSRGARHPCRPEARRREGTRRRGAAGEPSFDGALDEEARRVSRRRG